MIKDIVPFPNPVLTEPTTPVGEDDEVSELIQDLWDTVESIDGAGLAANQIGVGLSVAVVNNRNADERFVMINPEIIEGYGDKVELPEGCLSLDGIQGQVRRYISISVAYTDENGERATRYVESRTAQIVQHEVEHLQGKLYIDNYGSMRRNSMVKKYNKFLKKNS